MNCGLLMYHRSFKSHAATKSTHTHTFRMVLLVRLRETCKAVKSRLEIGYMVRFSLRIQSFGSQINTHTHTS